MARFLQNRLRAVAGVAYTVVRDTFFVRLVLCAAALWRESRFLSVLLSLLLLLVLAVAGSTAGGVFAALRSTAEGPFWPGLAAIFALVVMIELGAAGLTAVLHGLLRLSLDTGRHRIGALLTLLSGLGVALAVWTLRSTPAPSAAVATGWLAGVVGLLATAFWFERAYRRPAYPGFRDFHADVVGARHHLGRAAHGG